MYTHMCIYIYIYKLKTFLYQYINCQTIVVCCYQFPSMTPKL